MFTELVLRECIIEALKARAAECKRVAALLIKEEDETASYWRGEYDVATEALRKIRGT